MKPLRLAFILALSCALLVLGCRGGASEDDAISSMSAQEIKELMESHIIPGASISEIRAYLDSIGIEYTPEPITAGRFSFSAKYGIPAGTYVMGSVLERGKKDDISILFVLDDELRFERLIVEEHTSI